MRFGVIAAVVALGGACHGAFGSCPPTDQEKNVADYVSQRQSRVKSGEIAKQIKAGTYTIESLSDDMYRWWVQLGLVNQGTAIENFVNLMQQAKERAQKTDFLDILLGWLNLILGVLPGVDEVIKAAVETVSKAVETWKSAAEDLPDADFLTAAMKFRAQLPDSQTKQVRAVDDFVNALRNVPKKQSADALLAAYDVVTKIIASTASYRKSFNQYYLKYLDSAGLGSASFHYAWNAPLGNLGGIMWRTAPAGLDSCTIANFVYDLNKGCVSEATPGFEKMTREVEIMVNQGPATGLRLSCQDLDTHNWVGCWLQGSRKDHDVMTCGQIYMQARSLYGWPSQAAKDFCSGGVNNVGYTACSYSRGCDGPTCCQNGAGYYPPNCRGSTAMNMTLHEVLV